MALKAILTTDEYEALGDPLKSEYVKEGNGYRLDVEEVDGFSLANATAITSSASAATAERDKADKKLKGLQTRVGDFDLDQLPQAREALEKMADWDPDKKLDAHKKQFEEQTRSAYETEFSAKERILTTDSQKKDATIESRTRQLKTAQFESRALQLCSEFNADPTIVSVIRDRRLVGWEENEESGELDLIVLDDKGGKKLVVGGEGRMVPASLEQLFSECQKNPDKWGIFFKAPDKSGSGAGGSTQSAGSFGDNPFAKGTWNMTKQGELMRVDPATARRLAAAAGVPLIEAPQG